MAFAWPAAAQETFEPCGEDPSGNTHAMISTLRAVAPGTEVLGVVETAAATPSWGLRLVRDRTTTRLVRVAFDTGRWSQAWRDAPGARFRKFDHGRGRAAATARSSPVDPGLARRLERLARDAIAGAAPTMHFGADGSQAYLVAGPARCVTVWTPAAATRPGRIMALFRDLARYESAASPDPARLDARLRLLGY
jgi:hypothetical protein